MKKYKIINVSRLLLLAAVLTTLAGCAAPPTTPDVFKIGKEAAKAYHDKNWALAEQKYSYLLSESPNVPEIWFRLGNIYVHTKQPEKAIQAYREAVVRKPSYEKAWHNLGIISLRQTISLYLEILKNIKYNSPIYNQAKQTADALIKILEQRRKSTKVSTKVDKTPTTVPVDKPVKVNSDSQHTAADKKE